ncbi:sodium:proton antiporter [Gordoniibacillus kamchatkensis]|uniref:Nickel/cobalt efflux system n=1 Tax=Gordoniibacillus kamchatkensis TaxID=1590651 RepID=A0ABR5ACD0_9BACL|nr:sodium:proton antiporter [Paenibacillus sp. VKM B-2647]KIL38657.1 sodium:proton antiporter [Paenibacillus sp. VKM B-2647]
MDIPALIAFVFILGLRHGLDADHLACIDGLTRYNHRMNSRITRWIGTLFSLGHGLIVTAVAVIIGNISERFVIPDAVDTFVTWFSICSLFLIGTLNSYNLLRVRSGPSQLEAVKGRLIPRVLRETTNPLLIMAIGALFALAADTVSQTSVWALAAGHAYMPFVLGATFTLGMVLTDSIDAWIAYRLIGQTGRSGRSASRWMGWLVVTLAYGVSFYEAVSFFRPSADDLPELVGLVAFLFLLTAFAIVLVRDKRRKALDEGGGI